MRHALPLAVAVLALAPVTASAATAVSPTGGASTSSHPTMTWTLAPGETVSSLQIADNPATNPDGEFFDEHTVAFGGPDVDTATRWAPSSPLFAGRYWWSLHTFDAEYNSLRTPPSAFTVAASLTKPQLSAHRYAFLRDLDMTAKWTTNAHDALVTFRVSQGKRTVFKRTKRQTTYSSLDQDSMPMSWHNRKVKRGRKVKVTVTVKAGGRTTSTARFYRAP